MSEPVIEEIKSRLDIVNLISHYITLRQAGANFKGLCPFHPEKTPSFMVNRERQMFRCFGCNESGDIFAFVMKQENIDFPAALQMLAERSGVTLPEHPSKQKNASQKTELYAVNALATQFFSALLTKHVQGSEALAYLKGRGVSDESIQTFDLGYAPMNPAPLQTLLTKRQHSPQSIRLAGSPERFRDRVMFPLKDVIGHVVGFSGRALHDQMPKYLNTSETDIFHKNRYLYGLYEGKKAIGEAKKVILVEGQLDLVLAHQAGAPYTVATSGTALSPDHLRILRRYSDTLYLALDGDAAGQKATARAINLALMESFDTCVLTLPEESDPGALIAESPAAWLKLIEKPTPAIEWLFGYMFPNAKKPSADERKQILQTLFPFIALQKDSVAADWALQRLALLLETQPKTVRDEYEQWQAKQAEPLAKTTPAAKISKREPEGNDVSVNSKSEKLPEVTEDLRREQNLLGLLLIQPDLLQEQQLVLTVDNFTHPALGRLYNTIFTWYTNSTNKSSQHLIKYLEGKYPHRALEPLQKLLFDIQLQVADLDATQLKQEYSYLVQTIRRQLRRQQIEDYAQAIAKAAAAQDHGKVRELMGHMQQTLRPHLKNKLER